MLSCKEASRLVSQSQDRRLGWRERVALRLHLAVCDACREFSRQMAWLRQALRHFALRAEQDETVKLPAEAAARIRQVLHGQD
jgi:predicted anti-sigma-YlaC factor YlaD